MSPLLFFLVASVLGALSLLLHSLGPSHAGLIVCSSQRLALMSCLDMACFGVPFQCMIVCCSH